MESSRKVGIIPEEKDFLCGFGVKSVEVVDSKRRAFFPRNSYYYYELGNNELKYWA